MISLSCIFVVLFVLCLVLGLAGIWLLLALDVFFVICFELLGWPLVLRGYVLFGWLWCGLCLLGLLVAILLVLLGWVLVGNFGLA